MERRLNPSYWEKIKELNHLNDGHWDNYVERVKNWREVAARNILELYIEFYTEPRIHFTFESQDEWKRLRRHIDESGWRTFDLT